jgi:phosphatidylglycerophosphate synthase
MPDRRASGRLARSRKPRAGKDLVCEWIYRPAAHVVVLALLPLRVPPPLVVVGAACVGLVSAVEIGRGEFLVAALLLQLKTVLDNADGQLARLSGRVTAFGRYLDSESDLLVNAALFAALGLHVGAWTALSGFALLTLVLGVNFNVERLYRREQGEPAGPMPPVEGAAALLARVYAIVYGPQDRLVEGFVRRRLSGRGRGERLAWHDPGTVRLLANLGLSPQLAVFGLCLAVGHPAVYVAFLGVCAFALVPLALRRELLARRVPASLEPAIAVD